MIKDLSHMVPPDKSGVRLTLTLINPGSSLLQTVKAIKIGLCIGLRDSKFIVDESKNSNVVINTIISLQNIKALKEELSKTDATYNLNDVSRQRSKKLLELGVYDKESIIEELCDMHLFQSQSENFDILSIMRNIYSDFDESQLLEIYKKKSNESESN